MSNCQLLKAKLKTLQTYPENKTSPKRSRILDGNGFEKKPSKLPKGLEGFIALLSQKP